VAAFAGVKFVGYSLAVSGAKHYPGNSFSVDSNKEPKD